MAILIFVKRKNYYKKHFKSQSNEICPIRFNSLLSLYGNFSNSLSLRSFAARVREFLFFICFEDHSSNHNVKSFI